MKLTVIGPWGVYPKANSASAGHLVSSGDHHLLLDCGSGVLSVALNYVPITALSAVVLSHHHIDHTADVGSVVAGRMVARRNGAQVDTLPIYCNQQQEAEAIRLEHVAEGRFYDENSCLEIGPFRIRFLATQHSIVSHAIKVEAEGKSLVYTGDTRCFAELEEFVRDADLFLCDSFIYNPGELKGHMTATEAGHVAERAGAKHLILTHLPHHGDLKQQLANAQAEFSSPVELAATGLIWQG